MSIVHTKKHSFLGGIFIKKLIIAEKPDVMRKFVNALDSRAKSTCFAKPYVYYYESPDYIFAAANGHLFQVKTPEEININNKKWQASPLDVPDILPLKLIKNTSQSFQCIKELVKRKDIDEVIVATDPDREGQLIWELIQRNLKINVPVSRIWIKEWTPAALKKAFDNRKPNSTYQNLVDAGLGRLQADYLIGMTGTRTHTVCFGGYKNVINEGRVQSPTRYLVGQREKEILNFKPEGYCTITLQTTSDENTPLILNSGKLSEIEANSLETLLPTLQFPISKEVNQVEKRCPKLYKTNDILEEASTKLGLSADKTTEILQKLYQDYALTTYPRTEIQQISVSASKEVMKIVDSLDGVGLVDDIIEDIKENHLTFQKHLINSAGGEMPHEAITPTYDGNPASQIAHLSKDEKAVYKLIVKRFLQGFYSPAIIEETKVSTEANGYPFQAIGKTIIEASWMKIGGIPTDSFIPKVTNGEKYNYINAKKENKTTKPPARYTEATLLNAMENAGRYVEDKDAKRVLKEVKGIGTGATRNEIIKNLYKNNFITKKGKIIYPTEKLMQWMDATPDSTLKSPMMTATLETQLSEIENGTLSFGRFMDSVHKQIEDMIETAVHHQNTVKKTISNKSNSSTYKLPSNNDDLGVCPYCGKPMKENDKSYYCPGYKNGCYFSIWKEMSGKKITKATAKKLISEGNTGKLKGFKSTKTGKEFEARLKRNDTNHKIEFDFR